MGRRTLLLIVSILLAAVGTVLIALYVKNANDRAQTAAGTVQVYIAKTDIEAGTQLKAATSRAQITTEPATGAMATNAFTNLNPVLNEYTAGKIYAGTILRPGMLTNSAGSTTGTVNAGINSIGFTVDVVLANRAAGLLDAGDQARLYDGPKIGKAKVLLKSVKILSVGVQRTVTTKNNDQVPNTTVGLDIKDADARDIITALDAGDTLYLGVLGKDPQ